MSRTSCTWCHSIRRRSNMQHPFIFVHRYLQQQFMPDLFRTKTNIIQIIATHTIRPMLWPNTLALRSRDARNNTKWKIYDRHILRSSSSMRKTLPGMTIGQNRKCNTGEAATGCSRVVVVRQCGWKGGFGEKDIRHNSRITSASFEGLYMD